jgi:hypothetical protein
MRMKSAGVIDGQRPEHLNDAECARTQRRRNHDLDGSTIPPGAPRPVLVFRPERKVGGARAGRSAGNQTDRNAIGSRRPKTGTAAGCRITAQRAAPRVPKARRRSTHSSQQSRLRPAIADKASGVKSSQAAAVACAKKTPGIATFISKSRGTRFAPHHRVTGW